jgi:8-oxo-dGTP diphosphatase
MAEREKKKVKRFKRGQSKMKSNWPSHHNHHNHHHQTVVRRIHTDDMSPRRVKRSNDGPQLPMTRRQSHDSALWFHLSLLCNGMVVLMAMVFVLYNNCYYGITTGSVSPNNTNKGDDVVVVVDDSAQQENRSNTNIITTTKQLHCNTQTWHGGHPIANHTGSCWCNSIIAAPAAAADDLTFTSTKSYCMCTPAVAIDLVVLSGQHHVWLARRKDTGQYATFGGFVQQGESVEEAVYREFREESGIQLPRRRLRGEPTTNVSTTTTSDDANAAAAAPQLLGVYSDPRRDNRRHTLSIAYVIQLGANQRPVASDDVKAVERILLSDIESLDLFADHKTILMDCYQRNVLLLRQQESIQKVSSEHDFAVDIQRSVCTN